MSAALSVFDPQPPSSSPPTPTVDLSLPVRSIAEQMVQVLAHCGLYRLGESRNVVTIDDLARIQTMDPVRFCSWVEEWIVTYRYRNNHQQELTMGKDLAAKILASDGFLGGLPKLEWVAPVRLPVWVGDRVELMQPGFDPTNGIYCAHQVDFSETMDAKDALDVIDQLLCEFEFPDGKWRKSRSGAVQLAAMLSTFCRHLTPPGAPRPMIVYTSNQPGSGKSLLANMALAPVWGDPGSTDFPLSDGGRVDTAELRKELATAAIERRAYMWLDDAPARIYSNALNRFVTSNRHRGRVLGTAGSFDEPNVSQVFLTGNMLEITPDLMRRALVCELFVPGEVAGRRFRQDIDSVWLAQPNHRADMLAALWALVRDWAASGAPRHPCPKPPGFGQWTGIIGGMVSRVAEDPLADPDLPTSGDQEGVEFRQLLGSLATDLMDGEEASFTFDQIVLRARQLELLVGLVGVDDGAPLRAPERARLGRRLAAWRGRQLRDNRGRVFAFGSRRQRQGMVYPIEWV